MVKFYWAGARMIATVTQPNVELSEAPPGVPQPSPPWLPVLLLSMFGVVVILIVFAPGSGEQRIGIVVAPARALGTGALLLLTSTPLLLAPDCGGQRLRAEHRSQKLVESTAVGLIESAEFANHQAALDRGDHRLEERRLDQSCLLPSHDGGLAYASKRSRLGRDRENHQIRPITVMARR
jgi:hypothetical protein